MSSAVLGQIRSSRSHARICRTYAKSISLNRRSGIKEASIFFLFLLTLRLELQLVDPVTRCRGWHLLPPPHLTAITSSALLIWTLLFWLQVWLLCCIRFGRRSKFQGKVEDLVPSCTLHVNTVKWSSRDIAFNHTTDVLLLTTAVSFILVAVFLFLSSFHGQYQLPCLFQN